MKTLGIVPYINALPLIYSINGYQLSSEVPSKLIKGLENDIYDAALLPIYEVLIHPDLYIIDEIAIASQEKIGSVLLFLNKPIETVRIVGIDNSSLSSNNLLKLILKKYYQFENQFISKTPNELIDIKNELDGYLLIGDPAIEHRSINPNFIDLGEFWKNWTGLPFVFAIWATKYQNMELKNCLTDSKIIGLQNIDTIIDSIPNHEKSFLVKYYHNYLCYHLNDSEKKGLALYQKWLYEEKLIPDCKPLNFF